jgi:hypothetical protein
LNIFFLDKDPLSCARYHGDKNLIKAVLESSQLLESSHVFHQHETPYSTGKRGWVNHPCAKWVRESLANYLWLSDLGEELCEEFSVRYGHEHSYAPRFKYYKENPPGLEDKGWTEPYQAMPEDCRSGDVVLAYRDYYKKHKASFATWKNREIPEWFLMD